MGEIIRIALTGPESTAKSTLAKELASHFNGVFYTEYAREYFQDRSTQYDYHDLEVIARKQVSQYEDSGEAKSRFVFFDTWLIITRIWFQWVYQKEPDWLETEITRLPIDLYLLCKPDLPWEPDPLREHDGKERLSLFQLYKEELIRRNFTFVEIDGIGEKRIQNAIRAVNAYANS